MKLNKKNECEECYIDNDRITPLHDIENCLKNHTQYICSKCGRHICIEKDEKRKIQRWNFPFKTLEEAKMYLRVADYTMKQNCKIYKIISNNGRESFKIFPDINYLEEYLKMNKDKKSDMICLFSKKKYVEYPNTKIKKLTDDEINKYLLERRFRKERILIGEGVTADVYLWNNYAYKCIKNEYKSLDFFEYEKHIANVITKTKLNIPKYYQSEFEYTFKMEYIKGITLAKRMTDLKYNNGIDDLINLFEEIHQYHDLNLLKFSDIIIDDIQEVKIDVEYKERAIKYLQEIPDGNTLCHLDHHFLNVMFAKDKYYLIDWINAKNGNPIYDYARTYVICYEFAYGLRNKYYNNVIEKFKLDKEEFNKAIFIMGIQRLKEFDDPKIRKMLNEMY